MQIKSRKVVGACLAALIALITPLAAHAARPGGELTISGPLDSRLFARLSRLDLRRFDAIRLRSPGGDARVALSIAARLERSGRPVRVFDTCASTCLYVLAIRNVEVAPDTVIVAQHSPTAMYYAVRSAFPAAAQDFKRESDLELAWWRAHGVSPLVAVWPTLALEPRCIVAPGAAPSARDTYLVTRYAGWAPDPAVFRRLGLHAPGGRTEARVFQVYSRATRASLNLATPPVPQHGDFAAVAGELSLLPACRPEDTGRPLFAAAFGR